MVKKKVPILVILSDFLTFIALGLLAVTLIFYFQDNARLLDIYQFLRPISDFLTYPIFFIDWIVSASSSPEKTKAFISLVYTIFIFIFSILYISTKSNFYGVPKSHSISFQGLFDLIENQIYKQHHIPISLAFINRINAIKLSSQNLYLASSYKDLFKKYFKDIGTQYFGFYLIIGFMFLPYVAYDKVNNTELSIVPFWLAVIGFGYFQTRFLFELAVLTAAFTKNK